MTSSPREAVDVAQPGLRGDHAVEPARRREVVPDIIDLLSVKRP